MYRCRSRLSGLHADSLEATEGLQRSLRISDIANIYLHNLRTVTLACVLDRTVDGNVIAIHRTAGVTYFEGGIAQSIAEGEQGIVKVAIGTALHRVILIVGQLVAILIEGNGQLTARVDVTEKDVSHGRTALLTRIPGLYDGVAALRFGLQSNTRTGAVDEDDLFASSLQRLQELTLHLRQFNIGTVTTLETFDVYRHLLTFQTGSDTSHEDNLIDTL